MKTFIRNPKHRIRKPGDTKDDVSDEQKDKEKKEERSDKELKFKKNYGQEIWQKKISDGR